MVNKIIINGRGGSGKDTVADYLVEKYGFKKISFAEPIYDLAREYFDMKQKDRWLLQQIGQKFREIDRDVWIKYALKVSRQYDKVVISDCRQENEYITFVNDGFLPIRVDADLDIRIKRLTERDGAEPDVSLLENESETGADGFGYTELDNNGSFDYLYKQIDSMLKTDVYNVIKGVINNATSL